MRRQWRVVVLMALAMAGQAVATGYSQTGPDQAREATIRFDLYRNYLIVARGAAGPLKGLNFLLDTGASPTVLDQRLARKLHLEESPASMVVVDGRARAGVAIVSDLELGPVRTDNLPVQTEDLSFLQRALQVRIDGIVGLDVLGRSSFVIDYSSREIRFGPVPVLPVSVPLRVKDGLAIVAVEINHSPARLLFDTGASSLIFFETAAPRSVSGLKTVSVQRSTNMIGDFERREVWLHSLRFGEAELGQEAAFVVHNEKEAGRDFDGLMSPVALGITKVAVDLERGVLAFER